MRRFVVAGHGELAQGAKSALSFFVDGTACIEYMSFYSSDNEEPVETRLAEYFKALSPADEVVVLADLYGGSVHTAFYPYLSQPGFHLVAGFNLGLLLEIISIEEDEPLSEGILEAIENAKSGIIYTNIHKVVIAPDDEL